MAQHAAPVPRVLTPVIPIELIGYMAVLDRSWAPHFTAKASVREFNSKLRRSVSKMRSTPVWNDYDEHHIWVPFGIILHLIARRVYRFQITNRTSPLVAAPLNFGIWPDVLQLDVQQRRALAACAGARGGLIEAPTGCLVGSTEVLFNIGGKGKRFRLDEAFVHFHGGDPDAPNGTCRCGCGGITRVPKYDDARNGHAAGNPLQFLFGHGMRGAKWSNTPHVRSFSELDGSISLNAVENITRSGVRDVFRLELEDGKSILGTACHRIMTVDGWTPLGQLLPGQLVLCDHIRPIGGLVTNHLQLHGNSQYLKHFGNRQAYAVPVKLVAPAGRQMTYDIQCRAPHHNFIANGVIVHNSGKTRLELTLALACHDQHPTLMLVPSAAAEANVHRQCRGLGHDLPIMTYDEVREHGRLPERVIVVGQEGKINNDHAAGNDLLAGVGSIVTDEAHHWRNPSWRQVLTALPGLVRSFGLSATMFLGTVDCVPAKMRVDDYHTIAGAGPLLLSIPPSEVDRIDLPDVYNVPFFWHRDWVFKRGASWTRLAPVLRRYDARRTMIATIIRQLVELGRVTLVPVSNKEYGERLMYEVGSPRVACWFAGGRVVMSTGVTTMTQDEVAAVIERGDITALIVTSHIDEALDIPAINTTLLTEGRQSRICKQRVGRSIRKSAVKSAVVNLWDNDGGMMQSQSRQRSVELTKYYRTTAHSCESVDDLTHQLRILDAPTTDGRLAHT